MTTDRDTTRIVRSWLEEGVTRLPDPVLDAVLHQLPATSQRRVTWWPARRALSMNKLMSIGLAAAAVLVAVLVGFQLFASLSGVGAPDAEPSPTTETTASPAAQPLPLEGLLSAGRYSIGDPYPATISFVAPDGWLACNLSEYERGVCRATGGATAIGVAFLVVDNVVADPCSPEEREPPIGPSVQDLVTAISNLPRFEASTPTDVSVGGYPAKRFTVTAPVSPGCELRTWVTPTRTNGVGAGEENLILVVDVDGDRIMVTAAYHPAALGNDELEAIDAIIDSIEIDP